MTDDNKPTLLLNQSEINDLITMKDVVEICDDTFQGFGNGTTINPTKVTLDLGEGAAYPPYEGFMNAMPAYVGHMDIAGMKFVGGIVGERRKLGLPYLTGMITLVNPRTGIFTAVMEGAHITNLRTGAQTAIALKYLRQSKSIRVGLYGAGMQGRTQIQAISEVFDIEQLTIYDVFPEASRAFKADMQSFVKGDIIIAATPEQASDADAVITVTQSKEKFVKDSWLKPGTIFFPMGSYQECEDQVLLQTDAIVVDHVDQALHRGALKSLNAQGLIGKEHITTTIGELAAGKANTITAEDRVVCIPIGTGALDVAVAQVVLERARAAGRGYAFSFV